MQLVLRFLFFTRSLMLQFMARLGELSGFFATWARTEVEMSAALSSATESIRRFEVGCMVFILEVFSP